MWIMALLNLEMIQGPDILNLTLTCCITPCPLNIGKIFLSLSHTGFWDAQLCHRRKGSVVFAGIAAPDRPPPPAQRPASLATIPGQPRLRTRTPSELECCQSNGALCFINPLFIKVHQPEGDDSITSNPSGTTKQDLREEPISNSLETNNKDTQHSCRDRPPNCSSDHSDSSRSGQNNLQSLSRSTELQDNNSETSSSKQKLSAANCVSRSPPPRPPPPRFVPQHSAPPIRQHSMPEKISWINVPKEKVEERERGSSLLSRLGSSLSISPSSSPPKRLSISSPISIPRPSLPISLSSLSSSPRWAKASPSSSQEDAQCHLALEEQTIEKALIRAKLSQFNATRTPAQDSNSPLDPSLMTSKRAEVTGGEEEAGEECSHGGQRLSDMSLSTDSSDSLDFSQSSAFFLPPLHDPSPPTVADFNTHLPLSLPPSHLPYCSMEEDDDDEDDEDEEEPDYGVSLESDQDQDLTMVPPGHRTKRRPSASALVLQKALRGHLRKVSGVFNSLLTPEKRAIRRVVELSRDKGSYFGCLVQDYLSYMGEGAGIQAWQGYASGLELLQTLRQFITQMKSYLRQTSELEPPIESLIPEDQIGEYQKKSSFTLPLNCVLLPLLFH